MSLPGSIRIAAEPPAPEIGDRVVFPDACGLWRTLPNGVHVGDVVQLVPCPRCGSAPRLRFLGAKVEEVDPTTALTLVEKR